MQCVCGIDARDSLCVRAIIHIGPNALKLGASESCELLNSFQIGPSASQDPHRVQGTHTRRLRTIYTVFTPTCHVFTVSRYSQ